MTALDLLHKVFELLGYHINDKSHYYPEQLKNNPPKYYRLLQIEALLSAFNLVDVKPKGKVTRWVNPFSVQRVEKSLTPLEYFLRGDFLSGRDKAPAIHLLEEKIKNTARETVKGLPEHYFEGEVSLAWLFTSLLNYRLDIDRFTHKPQGFMEGFDIAAHYGHIYQSEISEILKPKIAEIDGLLALIIDPYQQDIPIKKLVEDYNYPDVNIGELDMDWLMKNY